MEILLLRHAKAADQEPGGSDADRPLTEAGLRQADRVGRLLAHRGLHPDVIVTSPAARAWQTAQHAAAGLGIREADIQRDLRIYEAGPGVLLEILAAAVAGHQRPMLVGHNPGFAQLAIHLGALPADWRFPKGAVARFEAPSGAALARLGGARLVELLEP